MKKILVLLFVLIFSLFNLSVFNVYADTQKEREFQCSFLDPATDAFEINRSFEFIVDYRSFNLPKDRHYTKQHYKTMKKVAKLLDNKIDVFCDKISKLKEKIYHECLKGKDINKLWKIADEIMEDRDLVDNLTSGEIIKVLTIYLVDGKKGLKKYLEKNKNVISDIKEWFRNYKKFLKEEKRIDDYLANN